MLVCCSVLVQTQLMMRMTKPKRRRRRKRKGRMISGAPMTTVSSFFGLNLPGLQQIKKDMNLPGKWIFPQIWFGGLPEKESVVLGLGDTKEATLCLGKYVAAEQLQKEANFA